MIAKIILIIYFIYAIIHSVCRHGEKQDDFNGVHAIIVLTVMIVLLYFAGTFDGLI